MIKIASPSDLGGINYARNQHGYTSIPDYTIVKNTDQIVFVAKNDEKIVGYISLTKITSLDNAEIEVFAFPARCGIGPQLMDYLIEYVYKETKISQLILGVSKIRPYYNELVNWYKTYGFHFIEKDGSILGQRMAKVIERA